VRKMLQSVVTKLMPLSKEMHSAYDDINKAAVDIMSLHEASGLRDTKSEAKLGEIADSLESATARMTVIETEDTFSQTEAVDEWSSLIARFADQELSPELGNLVKEARNEGLLAAANEGQNLGAVWQELASTITGRDKDMGDYAKALEKYTGLFQKTTNILSKLATWVSAEGESRMKVEVTSLAAQLDDILNTPKNNMAIAGAAPSGGLSKKEAMDICQKLGLDLAKCIHENTRSSGGDGSFCVIPDLSQIMSIKDDLPKGGSMSIAQYNAWKAGFDAQLSRIEDAVQVRAQKYTNTYGRFETYSKMLSEIIQSMRNMLSSIISSF
jgi:type III secretion system IpaD/SipD/SspD family effector